MISWMLALLLVADGREPPATPAAGPSEAPIVLTIDGSKEPERLPAYTVWENLFAALHSLIGKRGRFDASDAASTDFVRSNLNLTDEDIAALLPAITASWSRIQEATDRVNAAFKTARPMNEITDLQRARKRTILRERDDIFNRLSARGVQSLRRFEAKVRAGLVVQYTEGSLAQERLQDEGLEELQ